MVRKAVASDVSGIYGLLEQFSRRGVMLPRTVSEITSSLGEFFVFEEDGFIIGAGALFVWGAELGEIRSLAVKSEYARRGIGTSLVQACLDEARSLGIKKVFALTYQTAFFNRLGFRAVDKTELPQKIWGDCIKCAKYASCDETAVIIEMT
ncbi:N-acetyltransferase [bacterium]|nr:MAG: N-acetyltransferase [bacterium]